MYEEWTDTLQACRLFQGIDKDSLNVMLGCLKPRVQQYREREIVAAYGRPFKGVGIIVRGKVALTKEMYSGNRIMIGILGAGEVFGETVAFSDHRVWPMTVIAQEDCVLLVLPPDRITGTCSNICASHTALIMNMLRILSDRASMLDKKIELLSAKNIRGKISGYLLDACSEAGKTTFTMPMKRHELADYLGIPRPSLSREMGLMRDEGIIQFEGAQISIRDVLALEKSMG